MSIAIWKRLLPLVAIVVLVACSKDEVQEVTPNATLQVKAGSDGSDTTVSYPVQVFVFQGNECCAVQTIGDAEQTLSIALAEGTYTLYAIGGAAYSDYALPSQSSATPASVISLISGHCHADLMTATATATLVDGGTNTVILGMVRKVMLLQGVTISQVPAAASAVSVTIAPLWQNLTLAGLYDGIVGSSTLELTRQGSSRTWTSPSETYLLPPSSQPASISVNITVDGTTQSYTYSSSNELEAGYKINIEGTYSEAVGVTLNGTITGAAWQGERTISFDFNGTGGGSTPSAGFPAVGDTYEGCYVLASEVSADGQSAELTLLSPNQTNCHGTEANVSAALVTCGVAAVSGWCLPTMEQMQLVELYLLESQLASAGARYLYRKSDGSLGYHQLNTYGSGVWSDALSSGSYYLRPVATVTLTAE